MSNELLERLKQNEQQLKQMEKTLEAEISSKSLPADEIKKRQEKLSMVRNSIKNTEAQLSEFGISQKADSVSAPEKSGGKKVGLIAAVILSGVIIAGIIIMLIVLFPQSDETDIAENNAPYNPTATEEQKKLNLNGDKKEKENAEKNAISGEKIESIINSHITDPNTKFGIYVKNLKTGYTYGYNEHTKLNSSAISYLPIMGTAFWQADESGKNLYNDTMTFWYESNGREKPNSKYDDGTYFTIMDYIKNIAAYGDNNRANQLVDYVGGFDEVAAYMQSIGAYDTSIRNRIKNSDDFYLPKSRNTTTAYDTVLLFEAFLKNKYVNDYDEMKQMAKMCDGEGKPSGVRASLNSSYNVSNYNTYNSGSYNEVASVTSGDTELIISVLSYSVDGSADKFAIKSAAVKDLFNYIADLQFSK